VKTQVLTLGHPIQVSGASTYPAPIVIFFEPGSGLGMTPISLV
jgi:hypothetical protein